MEKKIFVKVFQNEYPIFFSVSVKKKIAEGLF